MKRVCRVCRTSCLTGQSKQNDMPSSTTPIIQWQLHFRISSKQMQRVRVLRLWLCHADFNNRVKKASIALKVNTQCMSHLLSPSGEACQRKSLLCSVEAMHKLPACGLMIKANMTYINSQIQHPTSRPACLRPGQIYHILICRRSGTFPKLCCKFQGSNCCASCASLLLRLRDESGGGIYFLQLWGRAVRPLKVNMLRVLVITLSGGGVSLSYHLEGIEVL